MCTYNTYNIVVVTKLINSLTLLDCCRQKFKMPIDLYYVPGSAPCRTVLLAAKAVGVDLNLKYTDLMKGEHLSPEFIKVSR